MAFIFQKGDRPSWCIGYSIRGRRYQKSLHTTDKKEANRELKKFQDLERARAIGALTRDYYLRATRKPIATTQTGAFLNAWIKEIETTSESPNTAAAYRVRAAHFRDWLIADQGQDIELSDLTSDHFRRWRIKLISEGRSRRTATNFLKTIRIPFRIAFEDGRLERNWPALVKSDKIEETNRRNFTLDEIRLLLTKANDFWRWAIMLSLYTGCRLGDACTLTWAQIDLKDSFIHFFQGKTRKTVRVPIAKPLLDEIAALPSSDDSEAAIWPNEARTYRDSGSGQLSKAFRSLLVECGLAKAFEDRDGQGKNNRTLSDVSFHSLRHSFVSLIKKTGASEAIAMSLAGHSSKAMSNVYTHVADEDKKKAIKRMPDVRTQTKGKK